MRPSGDTQKRNNVRRLSNSADSVCLPHHCFIDGVLALKPETRGQIQWPEIMNIPHLNDRACNASSACALHARTQLRLVRAYSWTSLIGTRIGVVAALGNSLQ
jgi:hypothetical protein